MSARRLVIAIGVLLLFLLGSAHAATPHSFVAKMDRVADGDSVTATTSDGTELRIRLLSIDAPKIRHAQRPGQSYGEVNRDCRGDLIGCMTV